MRENCLPIFDPYFLRFALSLMACKLFCISWANGNSIEHVPNPKIAKHLIVIITAVTSMNEKKLANKNPFGLAHSNGNLSNRLRSKTKAQIYKYCGKTSTNRQCWWLVKHITTLELVIQRPHLPFQLGSIWRS